MNQLSPVQQYQWLSTELERLIGPIKFSREQNLRLERIRLLLERLGNPQETFKSIHVGGTSGKGSTASKIAAILTGAGYRTGLHTSPHIQILNERHQINGQIAATSSLAAVYSKMKPAIETVTRDCGFGKPSYFEVQFALAMCYFQQEKVDWAVVEVGLGGTLDATNVLPARISVLTSVGLDHTEILGNTVEEIATDKAGIIKPGQTVICGFTQPGPRQIVTERCKQQAATLWQIGREVTVNSDKNDRLKIETPAGIISGMPISSGQTPSSLLAAAAVAAIPDLSITPGVIQSAFENCQLPARLEVLQKQPMVILDGAHNSDKMAFAAEHLAAIPCTGKRLAVLGLKKGKDATAILEYLLPHISHLIVTAFMPKALWLPQDPEELAKLAQKLCPGLRVDVITNPLSAIQTALHTSQKEDLIWVTGSLYLAGDIREHWYTRDELLRRAELGLPSNLQY